MDEPKPRLPIRRFDVFAEYQRVTNQRRGMPEDVAKGRAIWAAKVVAGRRFGAAPPPKPRAENGKSRPAAHHEEEEEEEGFRSLGGELQTDQTFEHEIVNRMGSEFYERVFRPAITDAVEQGRHYEDIRDTIRKSWK
jgi:hypothetical protein